MFDNLSATNQGIDFINTVTETDNLNILDYLYFYNGGGVAVGDINNDDLPDIFLSGNQVKNALYLNKGNLQFENISKKAGIEGISSWNTGAVMADINNDGFLDIYVCAVVGIKGFTGYNELFINNGDNTFTEQSKKYGLDFDTYSSNAAFLDYDNDGDLDMYLLNHAVHTQESYGHADLRQNRNQQTGDKLLRNDDGFFTDVSEEAGIFGGANSYGLGLAVSDFNKDGWPDIYIGNDFHEDDYFYLNNGDGTFKESLRDYFGHTTRFSMGNDVADINADGWPDLISLDMLPEDELALKSSEGDDNIQTQKMRVTQYGYHYQFTRNMLYLNRPDSHFEEVALQANIAATDWSWSALFADFNHDGNQDLFISNGIPKRPNDIDYIKFISSNQIQQKINNTKLVDQKALDMMPSGKAHNYIFKGSDKLKFTDMSEQWISNDTLASAATALADLDNDGDLDIIINNLNNSPSLYINTTKTETNYLKIKLKYSDKNTLGIGTKLYGYSNGKVQYRELYTVRGFQASSQPIAHFGLGNSNQLDSLKIEWPNETYQILYDVKANQTKIITPENIQKTISPTLTKDKPLFKRVEGNLGINFKHEEDNYSDFLRQKLMPYQASDKGPAVALGDINNDAKTDVFFGGSKRIKAQLFVQNDSAFVPFPDANFESLAIKEDVKAAIADFNGDGQNDIFIGTGGADFYGKSKSLLDTYVINNDSVFEIGELPEMYQNSSVVAPYDIDNDGDLDVFVGNYMITSDFGKLPESTLLINNGGSFTAKKMETGMVTDAIWDDYDNDGQKDLIVVGEWMTPKFFKNQNGQLKESNIINQKIKGLWQAIQPFDIDKDGDMDYLLGNWGLNSKFKASEDYPLKMFYADFDDNKQTETIICIEKNESYYPLVGLDDLAGQLVSLRKKFNTYKSFAGKSIEDIFDKKTLSKAGVLEVETLQSGYLRNEDGKFSFVPFNEALQTAPILVFLESDFDADGETEVLTAGNYFGVKPYHGRFDGFSGALLENDEDITLGYRLGLNLKHKSVRHLSLLNAFGKSYVLVTYNNDAAEVYEILKP
ncbi:hypothetical protein WPG_1884 [Winogradskyella sp. PG-2]|nr:hypothetical protein WPG_1884 [Winogradskyella sp. PG-2]